MRPSCHVTRIRRTPGRFLCLLGLALLAGLSGCGDDGDVRTLDELLDVFESGDEAAVDAAVLAVAARAQANPDEVIPILAERLRNYEGHRHMLAFEFRVDDPDLTPSQRSTLLESIGTLMPQRLSDYGHLPGVFRIQADHIRLEVARPSLEKNDLQRFADNIVFQLSAPGTVQLRLVVSDPADVDEVKSLWKGDSDSYRAYFASESKRLSEALKADRPFVPKDPQYRVVVRRPGPTGGKASALMVYDPTALRERFDTRDIKVRGAIDPDSAQGVLELTIDKSRHAQMETWSTTNQGRLVALLLNGIAMQTTRIGSPFRDRAVLRVGPSDNPSTLDWLKAFVAATTTGPYPARVAGALLPNEPEYLDLPIARALAHAGAVAEAPLREIAAEGRPIAAVARWALGEMTRIATGQGNEGRE